MSDNYRSLISKHGPVQNEADAFFRFVSSSDKRSEQLLTRSADTKLRVVHFTDIHVPSEVQLFERLRDFVTQHDSWGQLAHKMSAIGNAFAHQYHSARRLYTNILKKALIGFHKIDADHLVITGDLAHCGLEPEFEEMRAILKLTGWWGEDLLTVVPGITIASTFMSIFLGSRWRSFSRFLRPEPACQGVAWRNGSPEHREQLRPRG